MKDCSGDPASRLWMLGDSNPPNNADILEAPLDARHPARHNIWTPIENVIQEQLYLDKGLRLDTTHVCVRNAVTDPQIRQACSGHDWPESSNLLVLEFRDLLTSHHPLAIFTFGAFAFEFARRSTEPDSPQQKVAHWTCKRLGHEFRERVKGLNLAKQCVIPLLHVSIARGKFLSSHEHFCPPGHPNYFEYTGKQIGAQLAKFHYRLPASMWLTPGTAMLS